MVPLDSESFVDLLLSEVPEVGELVAEHVADHDEVLLHVLTAQVRDLAISEFVRGDRAVAARIADVYARSTFIASWPEPLRAEAERQRNWRA